MRLDGLQRTHADVFKGVVLDVGGKSRGHFSRPSDDVRGWIFGDIVAGERPDVVMDVAALPLRSGMIDVIKATEVFEHVLRPEQGLAECHRVLVPGGTLMLSVPFLHRVHADPHDYQRWTLVKWRQVLAAAGFEIAVEEITGSFFTVFGDMIRTLFRILPVAPRRLMLLISAPVLNAMARLDDLGVVKSNRLLGTFHSGYFFLLKKVEVTVA